MELKDFKRKHVQGLYLFNHYEHASGAFIQVHVGDGRIVFQDAEGNRHKFNNIDGVEAHLSSTNAVVIEAGMEMDPNEPEDLPPQYWSY